MVGELIIVLQIAGLGNLLRTFLWQVQLPVTREKEGAAAKRCSVARFFWIHVGFGEVEPHFTTWGNAKESKDHSMPQSV